MRNPIRSETDAFRLTVATLAIALIGALIGWLASPAAGVIVFAVLVLMGLVTYLDARSGSGWHEAAAPLREAAQERHPHGPGAHTRHVLVVANAPLCGEPLRQRLMDAGDLDVEVDVVAPMLASRVHVATGDIDDELRRARMRLEQSLEWLHAEGFAARGEVGDPDTTMAIADELRDFGADEVIVVTAGGEEPADGSRERAELDRLRVELDVPVTYALTG